MIKQENHGEHLHARAYARTVWKGYAVFKGFGVRIDRIQTVWGMPNGRGTGTIKLA